MNWNWFCEQSVWLPRILSSKSSITKHRTLINLCIFSCVFVYFCKGQVFAQKNKKQAFGKYKNINFWRRKNSSENSDDALVIHWRWFSIIDARYLKQFSPNREKRIGNCGICESNIEQTHTAAKIMQGGVIIIIVFNQIVVFLFIIFLKGCCYHFISYVQLHPNYQYWELENEITTNIQFYKYKC